MRLLLTLGWALAITGCAMETKAPAPTLNDIAFRASNTNATMVLEALVHDKLFPINDANTKLVWRDSTRKRKLKVASMMSQASFDTNYKGRKTITTSSNWQAWVTAVPQVREFCRGTGLSGDALELRLKQWLGVPPATDYAVFVEFWVNRDHLIRPCPDPEVTDTQCNIAFEMRDGVPVNPTVSGMPDYLSFFQDMLYRKAYRPNGAPWTRLGYTYDWNPATPIHGASEYIIKPDVTVDVIGATPIEIYCKG
jgi:hypothetical protein